MRGVNAAWPESSVSGVADHLRLVWWVLAAERAGVPVGVPRCGVPEAAVTVAVVTAVAVIVAVFVVAGVIAVEACDIETRDAGVVGTVPTRMGLVKASMAMRIGLVALEAVMGALLVPGIGLLPVEVATMVVVEVVLTVRRTGLEAASTAMRMGLVEAFAAICMGLVDALAIIRMGLVEALAAIRTGLHATCMARRTGLLPVEVMLGPAKSAKSKAAIVAVVVARCGLDAKARARKPRGSGLVPMETVGVSWVEAERTVVVMVATAAGLRELVPPAWVMVSVLSVVSVVVADVLVTTSKRRGLVTVAIVVAEAGRVGLVPSVVKRIDLVVATTCASAVLVVVVVAVTVTRTSGRGLVAMADVVVATAEDATGLVHTEASTKSVGDDSIARSCRGPSE